MQCIPKSWDIIHSLNAMIAIACMQVLKYILELIGKVIDDVFLLLGFGRICRSPWTGSRQPQYQDPLREAQEKSNSGKNKV